MGGVFRRYEIVKRIGVGGMAEVFLANAVGLDGSNRRVVIKQILPHYSQDLGFQKMLLDEAMITASLHHPNVVQALDFGKLDERLFIALEYVDGPDLARLLRAASRQGRTLGIDQALTVVAEVLKALHYAHGRVDAKGAPRNIVHRDVSASNVLVSRRGEVKLLDFGVAKATVRAGKTVSGVVKGNTVYMAPEQISGRAVDARSDVWGAGMLLHELLSGRHPLHGVAMGELLRRILAGEIDPPSRFQPSVPRLLDRVVMRALEPMPRLRYSSAEELELAIEEYAREAGLSLDQASVAALVQGLDEKGAPEPTPPPQGGSILERLGPLIVEAAGMDAEQGEETGGSTLVTRKFALPGTIPAEGAQDVPTAANTGSITRSPPQIRAARGEGPTRLTRHRQAVNALAVSTDRRLALSASQDQTAILWDLAAGRPLHQLSGHAGAVTAADLLPDGSRAVTGSRDRTLKVWSVASGKCLATLEGHGGWVFSVKAHPDRKSVLSCGSDRTVRRWDLEAGRLLWSATAHADVVAALAVTPDGKKVVSTGYDRAMVVWDAETGKVQGMLEGEGDAVRAVAVSPDGSLAATSGADAVVRIWDLASCREVNALVGHREPVVALAFLADGTRVLSAGFDGTIRLWQVGRTVDEGEVVAAPAAPVLSLAIAPGEERVLAGEAGGAIGIWPLAV